MSTGLLFCISETLTYWTGQSVDDIFGSKNPCYLFYLVYLTILGNQGIGGFSMALYRFVIVKWPGFAKEFIGHWNLVKIILIFQWLTMIGFVSKPIKTF